MSFFKIKCNLPSSGLTVNINELTNERLIALNKFVMNEDLDGFYNCLDSLIIETYPDISKLDILDKFFIYLNICAYSIKSYIEFNPKHVGEEPIFYSLFDTIDRLSSIKPYTINAIFWTKHGEVKAEIGIPTVIESFNNILTYNPLSSIRKIIFKSKTFFLESKNDYKVLDYLFDTENYNKLQKLIIDNFNYVIIVAKDKIELPILSTVTYRFLAESLFTSDLDYILTTVYSLLKYINLQPSEYEKMTPADSNVILAKLVKEKQEEQKAKEEQQESRSSGQFLK